MPADTFDNVMPTSIKPSLSAKAKEIITNPSIKSDTPVLFCRCGIKDCRGHAAEEIATATLAAKPADLTTSQKLDIADKLDAEYLKQLAAVKANKSLIDRIEAYDNILKQLDAANAPDSVKAGIKADRTELYRCTNDAALSKESLDAAHKAAADARSNYLVSHIDDLQQKLEDNKQIVSITSTEINEREAAIDPLRTLLADAQETAATIDEEIQVATGALNSLIDAHSEDDLPKLVSATACRFCNENHD
jgi:chromosome segregation ATPase